MNREPVFSHLDAEGAARMVDVGGKPHTRRMARAEARLRLGAAIVRQLGKTGGVAKGNVQETARIAGILAAKKTAELIPMCHSLSLDGVDIAFRLDGPVMTITAEARCSGPTGVEMEAMTAASVAALTVYDMCKSARKGIMIESIRLLAKTGGKSGPWTAEAQPEKLEP